MKKLNNKGFTLIELLAVVVILLAISVMAVSSISAAIERNKEKQNNAKKEVIISYAKLYYEENKNKLLDQMGHIGYIKLKNLDLSAEEMKDASGDFFPVEECVKYTYDEITGMVMFKYIEKEDKDENCPTEGVIDE